MQNSYYIFEQKKEPNVISNIYLNLTPSLGLWLQHLCLWGYLLHIYTFFLSRSLWFFLSILAIYRASPLPHLITSVFQTVLDSCASSLQDIKRFGICYFLLGVLVLLPSPPSIFSQISSFCFQVLFLLPPFANPTLISHAFRFQLEWSLRPPTEKKKLSLFRFVFMPAR